MTKSKFTQRSDGVRRSVVACVLLCIFLALPDLSARAAEFSTVLTVFDTYCVACHSADDPEGGLVLESYASVMKGGEHGAVVVPGDSAGSRLVQLVERQQKPFMPPGKRKSPSADEIAALRAWIDAGAPSGERYARRDLEVPDVRPVGTPRRPIFSLAFSADGRRLALGRRGEVEVVHASHRRVIQRFEGMRGEVNAIDYSSDGQHLVAAGGEPGRFGEARLWKLSDLSTVHVFRGHRDSIYAVAFSPDGSSLATGSYDQKVRIWDVLTGALRHELDAHNGAVFDLAFRPDGKQLASVSADRTAKIWDVDTGERLETLSATKELYAVAFSPDGKLLATGGADRRIRVWRISETAAEGTNPIHHLRFGHDGAIVRLTYSPDGRMLLSTGDDRAVKLWSADTMTERRVIEAQPDWPVAARFSPSGSVFAVGCLDGSLRLYGSLSGGRVRVAGTFRSPLPGGLLGFLLPLAVLGETKEAKAKEEPPKPMLETADPPGVQRGVWNRVRLVGTHLTDVSAVSGGEHVLARVLERGQDRPDHVWIEVQPLPDRPRGPLDLLVETPLGKTTLKLFVDDLVQIREHEPNDTRDLANSVVHPAGLWGTIQDGGDQDFYQFEADVGQTLVFDLAAKSIGSAASAVVTMFDIDGGLLASSNTFEFDRGVNDPLLSVNIPATGRYTVQVNDLKIDSSAKHFYRLTIGALPYVIGCFPLAVPANSETEVELVGFNLGADARASVKSGEGGEVGVPVDARRYRTRRGSFPVLVSPWPATSEIVESEPNDTPGDANVLVAPGSVSARIRSRESGHVDVDTYRFESKKGQRWMVETLAQGRGSPVDTRVEVLDDGGRPIEKVLLQAVRDTYINFRSVDSNLKDIRLINPDETRRNEYVYLRGDVCKVLDLPKGPDGGFNFYHWQNKRRAFFDTSATDHANYETGYIVEPHLPGARLTSSGLPVFPIYQTNDDDGQRRLGKDSKVDFVAPADGFYCVRVENVLPEGGDRHFYRLTVREPRPDFVASQADLGRNIPRGSGMNFKVRAHRQDGFDGDIRFDIKGVPDGFTVATPIVIQSGLDEAIGTMCAAVDAPEHGEDAWSGLKITASADIDGKRVEKPIGVPKKIGLAAKPNLRVELIPIEPFGQTVSARSHIAEMTIRPGESIRALLRIARDGHEGEAGCSVENLPFGVIVDDIGLSGVLIVEGETEREIFIKCDASVPETSRLCHAQAAGQYSLPVMLHVRR